MKSKVVKLDIGKLETAPAELCKLVVEVNLVQET